MANFSRTTKESKDLAEKIYFTIQDEMFRRETLNADAYDKAILTYSSGALALSIGFLKDFTAGAESPYLPVLFLSWLFFVCAIFSTVVSYLLGKAAIQTQLGKSELYYIHGEDLAIDLPNTWIKRCTVVNWASGLSFAVAALLTALFVALSLKDPTMSRNEPPPGVIEKIISGETTIIESFDPARMVRLRPPVDPVPAAAPTQTPTTAETPQQTSTDAKPSK